ncbi:hypothetical protein [Methanothrix sp.]|uniref:hypothetical protein n=1 Tax=Methanothrix sp. TaxID=90426 RepID=UPI002CB5E810|nr:hypothetical protein [Methanothrix sp.]HOK57474.1 hypothetical protein [Methanothrix sp.]HOL42671.1 hypothetical protein [Methanothrix sp.]HPO87759.1 hypothetical protein [Methanothrix sp.]
MRIIAISVLLMLFALAGAAHAGCPTGTGGVNWLGGYEIGSDTGTPVGFERPNMGMPKPVTKPDMSMPEPGPVRTTTGSGNASAANETNTTAESVNIKQRAQINLSGSWSMNLSDGRHVELLLYPVGTVFYGTGSLIEGNSTIPLKARGSVGEDVRLDLIQVFDGEKYREDVLYKLTLVQENNTISGSYSRFGTNGDAALVTGTGTVTDVVHT